MKTYWRVFLLSLQTELQYRANLVLWFVEGIINPTIMMMVWWQLLEGRSEIGSYDLGEFIMYYILITLSWYIVGGSFGYQLSSAIRDGDINKTLLKPYSVVLEKVASEQAWKAMSFLIALPICGVITYLARDYILWSLELSQLLYIIPSLVMAAVIFGLLEACVGTLAFWVTETWPFREVMDVLTLSLGGMLAPLSLLPPMAEQVSRYLPFRYIFYEPINLILGKGVDPLGVLAGQGMFILVLYGLYRLEWRAGIRRYEAIGG